MGRSPESSPLSCPCPTPVEPALEATEDEPHHHAVQILQATSRRKSSSWKGFNLKRQLSKVDMKIKNTFSSSEHTKRNSIFYPDAMSGDQELDIRDDEKSSSPDSDENTVIDNQSVIDLSVSPKLNKIYDITDMSPGGDQASDNEMPFIVGSLGTQYEIPGNRRVGFATRPDNLDLLDENGHPIRPARRKKKFPEKRDQRLLSVPNIKFQKPELQHLRDLRDKVEKEVNNQTSFAGNLMRRFSKS